jgi:hypothetical protein
MIKKILKTFLASDLIGDLPREILGRIGEKGRKDSGGIFWVFGCRRDFRDGGGGEAGRPAGPWLARDSRCDGRPWCRAGLAVPAEFTARAPREGGREMMIGVLGWMIELSGKVLKIRMI